MSTKFDKAAKTTKRPGPFNMVKHIRKLSKAQSRGLISIKEAKHGKVFYASRAFPNLGIKAVTKLALGI